MLVKLHEQLLGIALGISHVFEQMMNRFNSIMIL